MASAPATSPRAPWPWATSRAVAPPDSGTFSADGRWRITPQIEVFLESTYGSTGLSHPSPEIAYDTERLRQYSLRGGVSAETPIGLLSLSAYHNRVWLTAQAAIAINPNPFVVQETQRVTVVQASDLVKLGADHTLRFGLEYRENVDTTQLLGGRLSDSIFAGNVMWDWQIVPSLTATNAVRLDHVTVDYTGMPSPLRRLATGGANSSEITAPSLNSGLVWKATDADTFRLTLARGVQLPTVAEQGLQLNPFVAAPIGFFGRLNLRPSITWNAELDYDRSLPAISSVLRTALFAQRTDDVIGTAFSGPLVILPPGVPIQRANNVGYSTAIGVEVGIKGRSASGWRWNVSYALAETTNHTSLNQGGINSAALYSRSVPAHVVVAGIGYTREKWEADLMARWQSSFLDVRAPENIGPLVLVSVNNYVTANARVAYRATENLTLAVVAQQFNAPRLVTSAGAPQERRLIASATIRF